MPYNPADVLRQYVRSDGTKTSKVSDIFGYLQGKTYRAPLNIAGASLSANSRVIDVIAIGIDGSWLRPGQLDPVVMSLDFKTLMSLNLMTDPTFADSNKNYFSGSRPLYMNFDKSGVFPGIQIKSSILPNAYMTSARTNPWCGMRADPNYKLVPGKYDFWTAADKNVSNYSRNAAAMDASGVLEMLMLFYATDMVDYLQTRLGYRSMNHLDPYHWSNWLVASGDGTGGAGSRYFRLMYLTEFDFYMHGGAMSNISRLDTGLCRSSDFANAVSQLVTPGSFSSTVNDLQYFNTTALIKGDVVPAGQFVYSRDYQYKLHLTQSGALRVYQFPIGDDLTVCMNVVLVPGDWVANADNLLRCYLLIQTDGNIVVYANPGTSMQNDPNYTGTIQSYSAATSSFNGTRNAAIVIVGNFLAFNRVSPAPNMTILTDAQLFAALVNRNPSNAVAMISAGYPATEGRVGSGRPIAASGTAGNVYYAMSDYRVMVNSGGALVAVNAGLSSTIGSDQVGYVARSNGANWLTTDDSNNMQCVHGWKYLRVDGTGIPDLRQITDLTMQGDTKNWCYQNPFLVYTDSDGKSYRFGATDAQQILWYIGANVNSIDSAYSFLTSGLFQQAVALGYVGGLTIDSDTGRLVAINYCMRGNRWLTDGSCKQRALRPSTYTPALQRLIDYDIKNRICAKPTTVAAQVMCALVNPTGLSAVESSLIALDPTFSYACSNVSTGIFQPILYGIPLTGSYGVGSDDNRTAMIKAAIDRNASKLTEAQLVYLRKFYVSSQAGVLYTPNNTFVCKNEYLASEGAYRWSPDNRFFLRMAIDGNLTAYKWAAAVADRTLMWSSATDGNPSALLAVDSTGNVAIYSDSSRSKSLWSTGTGSFGGSVTLTIDNSGVVVLYGQSGPNGAWAPIWTSSGLSTYNAIPVVISPIVVPFDQALWQAQYQLNMGLSALPARTDVTYRTQDTAYGFLFYKDINGAVAGQMLGFDCNVLKAKGVSLSASSTLLAPSDIVWKYILGYLDINFPTQLLPCAVSDLMYFQTRSLGANTIKMLTSSASPYELQTWDMSSTAGTSAAPGTPVGNVLVFRLKSTAAVIAYVRSTGVTLASDPAYKAACANNMDACTPDYAAMVSTTGIDLSSVGYNTICDVANTSSGVSVMQSYPNYSTTIGAYTKASGFGLARNTAIAIVGNYMAAKGITGSAQNFNDSQLYDIMTGASTAAGVKNDYPGIFGPDNSSLILSACSAAYGTQMCTEPTLRYKAPFANKERFGGRAVVRSEPNYRPEVETFSGANCSLVCNDLTQPKTVQDACKTGSMAYCGQSDNIYGVSCTTDLNKYPELITFKNQWCANNPGHPNHDAHCTGPAAQVAAPAAQTGTDVVASGPTAVQTTQPVPTSEGTAWWVWLLVAISIIMFAAALAYRFKRKAATPATPIHPMELAPISISMPPAPEPVPMPPMVAPM